MEIILVRRRYLRVIVILIRNRGLFGRKGRMIFPERESGQVGELETVAIPLAFLNGEVTRDMVDFDP